MLLLIIISLGAFCACFNLYSVIVGDKSDKTMKQTDEMIEGLANEHAKEHQEKMVSLDEVCDMLYAMLDTHQDVDGYDYVTAPAYDTVEDLVEDFRKSMEKSVN